MAEKQRGGGGRCCCWEGEAQVETAADWQVRELVRKAGTAMLKERRFETRYEWGG